jgi:L-aspartate oxidase
MPTSTPAPETSCDLLVVGGGVAGLYAALCAADDADVLLLAKGPLLGSASFLAQGGVAAAVGEGDEPLLHAQDTLRAGRGLCRPSAVDTLTEDGPVRVRDLVRLGVEFDPGLGLEGGHSRHRVLHCDGAATGARIARTLAQRVLEHPRIRVSEGERVLRLWTAGGRCAGVRTDRRAIAARGTLLATGGYAALWERSTNPAGSVGDGIVLAYSAGAAVADLELVQFHPTALAGSSLLLSEALRGAGALLLDDAGRRFTDELAPRDVVARAIDERGTALLDLRPVEREKFSNLIVALEESGYDPAHEPVPVSPAAHYTMGGIVTDLDARTELPGLYAAGECACTGVHGANRLASNSLLECLVFGRRAALAAIGEAALPAELPAAPKSSVLEPVSLSVRRDVWRDAGLIRDAASLERMRRSSHRLVRLLAAGALARAESRGGHFRADFPYEDPALAAHTVLRPGREPEFESWR